MPAAVGATNVLVGQAELDEVLHPWGDGHLRLLPSGTPPAKPSELLASAKMGQLLKQVEGESDLVVVDSAPVLPVADTLALLAHADAVLLVVRAGSTTRAQVQAAVERLRSVDATIVGLVLNGADAANAGSYAPAKRRTLFRTRSSQTLMEVPSDVVAPPSDSSTRPPRKKDAPRVQQDDLRARPHRLRDLTRRRRSAAGAAERGPSLSRPAGSREPGVDLGGPACRLCPAQSSDLRRPLRPEVLRQLVVLPHGRHG